MAVSQGNSESSWNIMPRSGPGGPTGAPLRRSSPPLAGSKPPTMCRNVLLPQPDGPTMETNSCSSMDSDRRSMAVTLRFSTVNVLSRSLTSSSAIVAGLLRYTVFPRARRRPVAADSQHRFPSTPKTSAASSLRQVGEIDQRPDVGVLLLEPGLDLERLHLLQRLDVDPQARIAIVVVHAEVDLRIDPHHL